MPSLSNATQYRTRDGDMLDAICSRFYGNEQDVTEQVLAANPGLADVGPILPAGLILTLPVQTSPETVKDTVRLW